MNITLELQVFSGRPNPAWQLNQQECNDMLALVDTSHEIPQNAAPGGLGYSGFLLVVTPGIGDAAPYRIHVFNGITINRGFEKHYTDRKGLEKWLLQQASEKGYGAITDSL